MMEWIFTMPQLQESPSRRDGISYEIEKQYRRKTAWFIEELGKETKCDRLAVSTALVMFHRFYACQSFKQHNRFIISVACLFLASKAEECPRKLRDLVPAYAELRKRCNHPIPPEQESKETADRILSAERILLQTLGFDLLLVHPYKLCLDKIKDTLRLYIPAENRLGFHQIAINFINDSYRTTLCLQYDPSQIAIAAILLAATLLDDKPLNISKSRTAVENSWYRLLETDVDDADLKNICMQLLDGMEEDSRLNLTPSGERKERSYLKSQIEQNSSLSKEKMNLSSIVPPNSTSLDRTPSVCVESVGTISSGSNSSQGAGDVINLSSITPQSADASAIKRDPDSHPETDPSTSRPHPLVYSSNILDFQTKNHTVSTVFPANMHTDQQSNTQFGKRKASEYETNNQGHLNTNFRNGGP